MVLSDDRFATVAAAVEEGRIVFDNIQRFIFYLFSCNLSEALVVVSSVIAGLPLPLLPLQILWLNLVTDVFPALALAMEPAEPGIMSRPPRKPETGILSRGFVTRTAAYGVLITASTLVPFVASLRGAITPEDLDPRRPTTLAFMTLALAQLLHVFNARGHDAVLFSRRILRNRWIGGALALTVSLQLCALYFPPLRTVLRTVPLSAREWLVVIAAASTPLLLGQLGMLLRQRWVGASSHRSAGHRTPDTR